MVEANPGKRAANVADAIYVSRVKVEPVRRKIRRVHVPAAEEPVLFGVHGEIGEHYGVSPNEEDRARPPSII